MLGFNTKSTAVISHPERRMRLEEAGTKEANYKPTYKNLDSCLEAIQKAIINLPLRDGILIDPGVPGWLVVPEALKLSEMAYKARGNVLEFGTNRGLSTSIIANAIKARPQSRLPRLLSRRSNNAHVVTVDIDSNAQSEAIDHISRLRLNKYVRFFLQDAEIVADVLIGHDKKFDFCFVDHSHAYEPMVSICKRLPKLMNVNGFVLFHDYNDRKNTARTGVGDNMNEYGVYAAIEDALPSSKFEFFGIYGSSGLFRRI